MKIKKLKLSELKTDTKYYCPNIRYDRKSIAKAAKAPFQSFPSKSKWSSGYYCEVREVKLQKCDGLLLEFEKGSGYVNIVDEEQLARNTVDYFTSKEDAIRYGIVETAEEEIKEFEQELKDKANKIEFFKKTLSEYKLKYCNGN